MNRTERKGERESTLHYLGIRTHDSRNGLLSARTLSHVCTHTLPSADIPFLRSSNKFLSLAVSRRDAWPRYRQHEREHDTAAMSHRSCALVEEESRVRVARKHARNTHVGQKRERKREGIKGKRERERAYEREYDTPTRWSTLLNETVAQDRRVHIYTHN